MTVLLKECLKGFVTECIGCTCLVAVVMVVSVPVLSRDVDVLSQNIGQPTRCGPVAPAACGRRRGGGRGWRGGRGWGRAVDGSANPVLHTDAPLPTGWGPFTASTVLFFSISTFFLITLALPFTLWAWGSVWGRMKVTQVMNVAIKRNPYVFSSVGI